MEKIILRDKTEIEVLDGMTEYRFIVIGGIDKVDDIYNLLTDENLEEFKLMNDGGATLAVYKNKSVASCTFENERITFVLKDVNVIEKKIEALENTVDMLTMAILEG